MYMYHNVWYVNLLLSPIEIIILIQLNTPIICKRDLLVISIKSLGRSSRKFKVFDK